MTVTGLSGERGKRLALVAQRLGDTDEH